MRCLLKIIGLGDVVYWSRTHPETGIYEVCELRVRTVYPDCFVGVDKDSRRAFILSYDECDETVFDSRATAVAIVKESEKNKKTLTVDRSEE